MTDPSALGPILDRLRGARALGARVMDRCNLTILEAAGQEDLAAFLADETCLSILLTFPFGTQLRIGHDIEDGAVQ